MSQADATIFDIVPDSFRLVWARPNLTGSSSIACVFGAFFHGRKRARKWALDETTPFELERIANPVPVSSLGRGCSAPKSFPVLIKFRLPIVGGLIDILPYR